MLWIRQRGSIQRCTCLLKMYHLPNIEQRLSDAAIEEGGTVKRIIVLATLVALMAAVIAASSFSVSSAQTTNDQYAPATGQTSAQYVPTSGQRPNTAQQNTDQNQSAQSPAVSLKDLTSLDANNNLVVNCATLTDWLTHFQQVGQDTIVNDPMLQLEMMQAEDLAQLCSDDGFSSSGQPSGSTSTNSGQ